MLYGDPESPGPAQEAALAAFVAGGKGLIAMHAAASPLTGGRMAASGGGEFRGEIVQREHPVMKGLQPFDTWEETFAPAQPAPADRTVLMERVDGAQREPLTWVRAQGKGRVFYTAYGHDRRTWSNRGFQKLIEQARPVGGGRAGAAGLGRR